MDRATGALGVADRTDVAVIVVEDVTHGGACAMGSRWGTRRRKFVVHRHELQAEINIERGR